MREDVYKKQTEAETAPTDDAAVASLPSFTKPPQIKGFLQIGKTINVVMHTPAIPSTLSPKLKGVSLLKNPASVQKRTTIVGPFFPDSSR